MTHTAHPLRLGAAALAMACTVLAACDDGAGQAVPVRTAAAAGSAAAPPRWSTPGQIKAQCLVQSQRTVKLKAELGGRIATVEALQGQAVEPGQLLARIDTQEQGLTLERMQLSLLQSQARIELLTVQIRQAEAHWQAMQPLYQGQSPEVLPKEALALREKRAELRLTELSLADLQLQVRNLERVLRQAEIRSPMRGVVMARNAEVGMVVAPGVSGFNGSDVLFELGDPDKLRAECAAREADASQLRTGQPMTLVLDGLRNQEITLTVTRIAPAIQNDSGSSNLPFWGDFDRPADAPVLAGMHGNASVQLKTP